MILEFDADRGEPIIKGDQLGELGDEHPGKSIEEFVCTGPKSYVLRTKDKVTEEEGFVWRCKGIPLNTEVMGKLSFERFKELALNFGDDEEEPVEFLPIANNFRIQKGGKILTIPMEKRLRPTINKGNVDAQHCVRFFGYSNPDWCKENNPNDCTCKY
jgi:hypothetical protein